MLSRFLLRSRNLTRAVGKQRSMSDYAPAIKEPHMNDVPLPQKFEEVYQKRQVGNNAVLIGGITFFTLTLYTVYSSGVLFNNPMPPKKNLE